MFSAILAAILAAGAAFCTSPYAAGWLRPRLQAWFNQQGLGEMTLGGLELGLFPPHLIVTDVMWTPEGDKAPALRLARGKISPDLWPSPSGVPVIASLMLTGLQGTWCFEPDGLPKKNHATFSDPTGPPWRLPIDIRSLVLRQSDVTLCWADNRVQLQGIEAELGASPRHGRFVRASLQVGRLNWPARIGPQTALFSAHVAAELQGSLDRPQALNIQHVLINFEHSSITLAGQVHLPPHANVQAIGLKLNINTLLRLDDFNPFLGSKPHLAGRLLGQFLWRGNLAEPSFDIELSCEGLEIGPRNIGTVQIDAAANRRNLTIESVHLYLPDGGGSVVGNGRLGLESHYDLDFSAHLNKTALPAILEASGLQNPWIHMSLLGDVQGTGNLQPFHLNLITDVDIQNFQVLDRTFHDPAARAVLHIPNGNLRGNAEVSAEQTHVDAVEVSSGSSQLTVQGTFPYNTRRNMDLKVLARGFELTDLGPIARVPFTGLGGFEAQIQGPYNHADVQGSLNASHFTVYDYQLGDVQAKLHFVDNVLAIETIEAQQDQGHFNGTGRLLFGPKGVQAEGTFDAERLDLATVLLTVGLKPSFAQHFGAEVSGKMILKGPLKQLAGTAELQAPHLRIDGVSLGAMQLVGSFGKPPARLWGTLTLQPDHQGAGALVCHSELFDNGSLSLSADLDHIPIPMLTPFIQNVPLQGALTAHLDLQGRPKSLSGPVHLEIEQASAWGVDLASIRLEGRAEKNQLHLEGSLLNQQLQLQSKLTLGGTWQMETDLSFADLHLPKIPFARRVIPDAIDIQSSGHFAIQGPLTDPDAMTAHANLKKLRFDAKPMYLENQNPVVVRYQRQEIWLDELNFSGPHLNVQLEGRVPFAGEMNVKLGIAGQLEAANALWPEFAHAQGPWSLQVHLLGPLQAPTLFGEAQVHNANLRLGDTGQMLEKLGFKILFNGRNMALQNGTARLGGGKLWFGGQAHLANVAQADAMLDLHVGMQSVQLRPTPELSTTLTGNLDLSGRLSELLLHGQLKIDALRYTARLDLEHMLPKRNAAPWRSSLNVLGQQLRLNIKLRGPNNLIVSSNLLEAELQADLTLTGNTERIGLLGNITPLWAHAQYRDNTFQLNRASIDFVDEYRIFPEFMVQAHTQACNMQADVTVQGNPDNYIVTTTGQDDRGTVDPQDVLACLQFGLRLGNFAGNQKNAAGLSDALPGGLDALWAVSGLDDKVRKLLPITVDEIRLTSGWSSLSLRTTARVLVGKQIAGQVGLKYSRSLDSYNDQAFSVEYRLLPHMTLQGIWMSALDVPVGDFGADMRLHWERR